MKKAYKNLNRLSKNNKVELKKKKNGAPSGAAEAEEGTPDAWKNEGVPMPDRNPDL
jgi:hypothetical protein